MAGTEYLVSFLLIKLSSYYLEHLLTLPGKHWYSRLAYLQHTLLKTCIFNFLGIALSKGKRVKKSRIIWCRECQVHYNQHCLVHPKVSMQISDQPVVSRARASLPSSYLVIKKVDRFDFLILFIFSFLPYFFSVCLTLFPSFRLNFIIG